MGDSSLAGDARWSGTYGVNLDYVARSHCSVEFISIEDIQVSPSVSTIQFIFLMICIDSANKSFCLKVVVVFGQSDVL
jgi:hypothetical protein